LLIPMPGARHKLDKIPAAAVVALLQRKTARVARANGRLRVQGAVRLRRMPTCDR